MKKKQLIIISVFVVIAIIGISLFYPPADESETMGTIGKADKYRNDKTGQEKIILRNEFLQDTLALKATIIALAQYENYLNDMTNDFNEWENSVKDVIADNDKLNKQLDELDILEIYMNNNLNTVANTRELLTKYYTKDTVDMSIDVQNNLIEFSTFLTNLDTKSSVVDSLFVDLTNMLDEDKIAILSLTKEETEKLKVIREKMLGGLFVFGYVMRNESKLNLALNSNIMDAMALNRELNNKLGGIGPFSHEKLGFLNKEKLGMQFGKEELGMNNLDQLSGFWNGEKLGFTSGSFNREKLNSQESLGSILLSNELAAAMKNKSLGFYANLPKLGMVPNAKEYVFSKEDIGNSSSLGLMIRSNENLDFHWASNQLESFTALSNVIGAFCAQNKLGIYSKDKLGVSW